jgi:hypothetical protein
MLRTLAKKPILTAASAAVLYFCSSSLQRARGTMTLEDARQGAEFTTRTIIDRFNEASNRHDADAVALLLTDDTVFAGHFSSPGQRIEGKAAVAAFWRGWFALNSDAKFESEETKRRPRRRALGVSQSAQWAAVAPPCRGRIHCARWQGSCEACLC